LGPPYTTNNALRQVRFDGAREPDRVSHRIGESATLRAGTLNSIACMRAMLHPANEEVG